MENLSHYLSKFKKIISSKEDEKKVFISVIQEILSIELIPDVEIKGDCIYVHTKPIIKNEIFLHKKDILEALEKRGITTIKNLR